MWYASLMPKHLDEKLIKDARAAIANAQRVRRFHRRRTETDSQQRKDDIEIALARLKEAMKPIRSERGRAPYGPQTDEAEADREKLRELSEAIQAERRKLWKMKRRQI